MNVVLAKLEAFMESPDEILRKYQNQNNELANYEKSIALFRKGEIDKGLSLLNGVIAKKTLLKNKSEIGFLYEIKGQFLFESGNIYKLNSDSAVFKLFLKTEGTKYSMIKYSKKKDLVHLINNFSICCYDYKSSEKIYTSHYHVQIGKFEYDKTEDNFIMSWSGIDLLGKWVFLPDTIVVPLFGIYNIKTGNLLRLKKISIPGDLLAINPISQSEVAFISTNNGVVNYGIFRDRKDALAYDEIQINGSISGEKRGGHHNIANILVDGHGLLIFHINGKFY